MTVKEVENVVEDEKMLEKVNKFMERMSYKIPPYKKNLNNEIYAPLLALFSSATALSNNPPISSSNSSKVAKEFPDFHAVGNLGMKKLLALTGIEAESLYILQNFQFSLI